MLFVILSHTLFFQTVYPLTVRKTLLVVVTDFSIQILYLKLIACEIHFLSTTLVEKVLHPACKA